MATTEPQAGADTRPEDTETDEVGCADETKATLEGKSPPAEEDVTLTAEEEAELDRMLEAAEPDARAAAPGLGPKGGGLGGSEGPIKVAMQIGIRNGLTITSTKRSSGNATSDHHVSQTRSSAADMSNGSSPTPQMDRTAREIATLLGHAEFRSGNLRVNVNGYRVQMLWRTDIGGNHFNHVHVGVRVP